jgi:glycosyltransferase involved in cell wall biosynthesis
MTTIAAGDTTALAAALEALIADAAQGQRARRTVEQHFSWDACGAATVAAYEDALGR